MIVKDIIYKKPVTIEAHEPIYKALQIIFSHKIGLLPVVENKVLAGVITEKDILSKLLPSMEGFLEDISFEDVLLQTEKTLPDYLKQPVRMIMQTNPRTVTMDTPLMKAQSIMILKNIHRLPVVDAQDRIVGVVTQSNIFKALIGQTTSFEIEQFYEAYGKIHDLLESTDEKEAPEIDALDDLFEKNNVYRVVDIFAGTGGHSISLAKRSYEVFGLNSFEHFHKAALEKFEKTKGGKKKGTQPNFIFGDYLEILKNEKNSFDAAILMGNVVNHYVHNYKEILEALDKSLVKKKAVLVVQMTNYYRMLETKKHIRTFKIVTDPQNPDIRYSFMDFYNDPDPVRGTILYTISILKNDAKDNVWTQKSVLSIPIKYQNEESMVKDIRALGFTNIHVYGSKYMDAPFSERFNKEKHDQINIVARR